MKREQLQQPKPISLPEPCLFNREESALTHQIHRPQTRRRTHLAPLQNYHPGTEIMTGRRNWRIRMPGWLRSLGTLHFWEPGFLLSSSFLASQFFSSLDIVRELDLATTRSGLVGKDSADSSASFHDDRGSRIHPRRSLCKVPASP